MLLSNINEVYVNINIYKQSWHFKITNEKREGDFAGGPVTKTPRSQCRGPEFDPWSGN